MLQNTQKTENKGQKDAEGENQFFGGRGWFRSIFQRVT
jgi:hypothetical protein